MRKILALTTLCLLPALPQAQPSRDDVIRAQYIVMDRLAPLAFTRQTTIQSYDKNGKLTVSAAYIRRYVSLDDGTLHTEQVTPTLKLYGVTLTRLDESARFRPVFVTTASVTTFERIDGALYVLRVERLNGLPGFEGRVWVSLNGFVALAEGRTIPQVLKRGERPMRFKYRARPASYLPAEVVEEDRRVKIVSNFTSYMRHVASSRVVEEGEP